MSCPECLGPRQVNHPAGALVYVHRTDPQCRISRALDQTQAADAERTAASFVPVRRPPTPTEQTLLASLGLPAATDVEVKRLTSSTAVVRRTYYTATGATQ